MVTWANSSAQLRVHEGIRVGLGADEFNIYFFSDYSGTTYPNGGSDATDNAVAYAIRFKSTNGAFGCTSLLRKTDGYDATTNTNYPVTYLTAADDAFKCAYRFTRVGGANDWEASYINNTNMTNRFIIDVVYLGEEATPTELATVSDEAWWATKKTEGKVFSRTFSAPGNISPSASYPSGTGYLYTRGYWSEPISSGYLHQGRGSVASAGKLTANSTSVREPQVGFPVRLFSQPVQ